MEKNIKLEEMEYRRRKGEYPVLSYGEHQGRHFFIVSIGGEWPVAYVEAKPGEPDDYASLNEVLKGKGYPHGGLTYGPGNLLRLKKSLAGQGVSDEVLKLKYWGWDYAHYDDYCTWLSDLSYSIELHPEEEYVKHNVDEIYEEDVVPFIDWLEEKFRGSAKTKEKNQIG